MRASLVFGRVGYRLSIGLFEKGEDTCGCLVAGLMKEGHDVLRPVLSGSQYPVAFICMSVVRTSPKIRLNMLIRLSKGPVGVVMWCSGRCLAEVRSRTSDVDPARFRPCGAHAERDANQTRVQSSVLMYGIWEFILWHIP